MSKKYEIVDLVSDSVIDTFESMGAAALALFKCVQEDKSYGINSANDYIVREIMEGQQNEQNEKI